jgi:ribosomal protein S25
MLDENEVDLQSEPTIEPLEAEFEEVVEAADEQPADSEPDSDTEHEEKAGHTNEPTNPKIEERIGELTRKRREAERLADQRQEELVRLQSHILDQQEPNIPELPDPDMVSDREFNAAVMQRDQAVQQRVSWEQQKQQFSQQQQYGNQQQQLAQQQHIATVAQVYTERATKMGISTEQLTKASQVISQVGLNEAVAMHILQDEKGAAITAYLGNNINELMEIAYASPIQAAMYIEQKVKPKLAITNRKSNAPRPPSKIKGGTPSKRDKYPLTGGRATFE